jgi:hypothetical protein
VQPHAAARRRCRNPHWLLCQRHGSEPSRTRRGAVDVGPAPEPRRAAALQVGSPSWCSTPWQPPCCGEDVPRSVPLPGAHCVPCAGQTACNGVHGGGATTLCRWACRRRAWVWAVLLLLVSGTPTLMASEICCAGSAANGGCRPGSHVDAPMHLVSTRVPLCIHAHAVPALQGVTGCSRCSGAHTRQWTPQTQLGGACVPGHVGRHPLREGGRRAFPVGDCFGPRMQ